jgi:hypothetical protein
LFFPSLTLPPFDDHQKLFVGIPAGQDNEQKDSEGEEEMTDTTRSVYKIAAKDTHIY